MNKINKQPLCKKCNKIMILDDEDRRFSGNTTLYFQCNNCNTGLTREIRFYQIYEDNWYNEEQKYEEHIKNKINIPKK